jgi:NADPH:quinone reductase-like Zn-dependent oxidoreductase
MEAIVQDAYGSDPEAALQVAEVDKPTVSGDEVLDVRATSVDRGRGT